jgi:uncharacterized protein DUF6916
LSRAALYREGLGDHDRVVTRRQLLAWGATAGAAATLHGLVAAPLSLGRESWVRRATYARRVGETFRAVLDDGTTVALRLVAVDDLAGQTARGRSLAGRDDAFLLEFLGPDTPRRPQGVYELRHRALGRARLFLVPHESTYVAVVNRADR